MTGTRIIAALIDKQQLVLYKEDGETIKIPQGDHRLRKILDDITPVLNAGGVAIVQLDAPNDYADFEKKTNGLVKLFRVAKKAVAHLFGTDDDREKPIVLGRIPKADMVAAKSTTDLLDNRVQEPAAKSVANSTIDEIMSRATPVSSTNFGESTTTEADTIIAVVGEGASTKIVPGVEALKSQFAHSVKVGSTVGVQNLIARLGAVIETRGHSVQDVLRFLEKGDLPISDDGSILAYKMLKNHPSQKGTFVDCHTGKIPQKVGSFVRVDESLVDRNRRNECSNGLHIARRSYLRSFGGDVCVLTKIAPEDVVTVPHGDPNKVRVCAYHILGVIPAAEVSKLKAGSPMTADTECQKLLGQGISGRHINRLEEVLVTAQMGGAFKITPLIRDANPTKTVESLSRSAPKAVALDDETVKRPEEKNEPAAPVDPKQVSKDTMAQKASTQSKPASKPASGSSSRTELAAGYIREVVTLDLSYAVRKAAADALVDLKKRSKVSYAALGLSSPQERLLQTVLTMGAPDPELVAPVPTKLDIKPPKVEIPAKVEAKPMSRLEQARDLVNTILTSPSVPARETASKRLMELKASSKVSWDKLGVSDEAVKAATFLTTPQKPGIMKLRGEPVAVSQPPPKKLPPSNGSAERPHTISNPPAPPQAPAAEQPKGSVRQQVAQEFYLAMTSKIAKQVSTTKAAQDLLNHKKRSKVSWVALGLPEDTGKQIDKLLSRDN